MVKTRRQSLEESTSRDGGTLGILGDTTNSRSNNEPSFLRSSRQIKENGVTDGNLRRSARLERRRSNQGFENMFGEENVPRGVPRHGGKFGAEQAMGEKKNAAATAEVAHQRKSQDRKRAAPRMRNSNPRKKQRTGSSHSVENPCADSTSKKERGNGVESHTLVMNSPFDAERITSSIAPHDSLTRRNELFATEYVTDIYQRLHEAEERYRVQPYTATHDFLDTTARTIQVDRLCLLQHDLRLYPETLFLSVQILDRYCSVRAVSLDEYELVGITALLVASKYEEVDPPFIREIPVGVDASEVIEMEQEMLIALEYRITAPTGYHFLRRFAQVSRVTKMMRHAADYYLERSLLMEDCLSLLPSEMATAAVCLAIGHPDLQEEDIDAEKMTNVLLQYTTFPGSRIKHAASLIVAEFKRPCISTEEGDIVNSVFRKFSRSRRGRIAKLRIPSMKHLAFN